MSRHRSGEGYQNISVALKVPKNTVASIILKFEEVCCVERWKNLPEIHSGLYGRGAWQKPLFSKRHMTARLEFAKRHLKTRTMRNKVLWSDETKIELFGLNVKRHLWRQPGTILMVKHGGGSIMLGDVLQRQGLGD